MTKNNLELFKETLEETWYTFYPFSSVKIDRDLYSPTIDIEFKWLYKGQPFSSCIKICDNDLEKQPYLIRYIIEKTQYEMTNIILGVNNDR